MKGEVTAEARAFVIEFTIRLMLGRIDVTNALLIDSIIPVSGVLSCRETMLDGT